MNALFFPFEIGTNLSGTPYGAFDTVVLDRETHVVALVQVKGIPMGPEWKDYLPRQLEAFGKGVPFVLTVDPLRIHVYEWNGQELVGPVVPFDPAHEYPVVSRFSRRSRHSTPSRGGDV